MRVVVDTNILVSALFRPQGRVGAVLQHLRDGRYTLLYGQSSPEELVDVLMRPRIRGKYGLSEQDVESVVALILLRGEPVAVDREITACRDPKDNKFLEIAFAAAADAVVSGDQDLLVLHPFEGIPILSPSQFLSRVNEEA